MQMAGIHIWHGRCIIQVMNSSELSKTTYERLSTIKREIESLNQQQAESLKSATFVGMTPDEAKEYDERRKKIARLVEEMRLLKDAQ